jgi:hypothetical protein
MSSSPNSPSVRSGSRLASWSRRTLYILLALAAILIGARLAAPGYIQHAINQRLNKIPGYAGHVGDIDLAVWRGAYRIRNIEITKRNGQVKEPFFAAQKIDFSLAWRELFHRKFVSDISVENGRLNFVRGPTDESSQLTADRRWQEVINDLFPIDITSLTIDGGVLRYADTTRKPAVDVAISDLKVNATGLRNRPADDGDEFPAKVNLSGQTPGHGRLHLFSKLEPLAVQPHLELNVELKDVSLPVLNNFLRAYANIDVSRGRFELFGQMAMGGGHYEGYVKPFLDQIDFKDLPNQEKSIGQRLWETVVSTLVKLVKNKERNQFATRIPFSGESGKMDVQTWTTIANTLHHGFVQALQEGFEGTTHPDDPKTKVPNVPEAAASSPSAASKSGSETETANSPVSAKKK